MRVFDNGLRCEDGMSAGLLNDSIELGLELSLDGHALNYEGTTIGVLKKLEKQIPHRTKERKDFFYSMKKKWYNIELRTYSIGREEQRLATWESESMWRLRRGLKVELRSSTG